jgi:peptidoglycan/xylan/chitin deacetylase (PgdA/CDA1 family)
MPSLPSVLAEIQAPTVEVRDHMGELIGRVDRAGATEMVARGWATPVGKRALKYLRLRDGAPWKPGSNGWPGGSRTTQRVRADGGSGVYEPGQFLGWKRNLEHKKV